MKQIVIYKSRTGFTKKYAKWLAQSLNCECIPQEDVGGERLSDYDVIIFGSSFRARKCRRAEMVQRDDSAV